MKKILFLSLIMYFAFVIASSAFATEIVVSTPEELATAFADYSKDTIKLGADILISNGNDEEAAWADGPFEVSGDDRVLDFNGHKLIIENDEYIKINYRTNNNLTITDNGVGELGGIYAENANRSDYNSPFEIVNYTFSYIYMTIEDGVFIANNDYIFEDMSYFRLTINGGSFKSNRSLLEFSYSYDSNVIFNRFTFSLCEDSPYSTMYLSGGKFSDKYIFIKLKDGNRCFLIDDQDTWTDISVKRMGDSYSSDCKIVVIPESEAPEGALLPEMPNIKIQDGVITWDALNIENVYRIKYECGRYESSINSSETSLNMYQDLTNKKYESDTYYIKIFAQDSSYNQITRGYVFEYEYETPFTPLINPTNLRWEDTMTAAWDAVPNATSYTIGLYLSESGARQFGVVTSDTSYDFSSDYRFSSDKTWYFRVTACADGYLDSYDVPCEDGKTGWFTVGDLSNVTLSSNGVLSWDAYEGATNYSYLFKTGGGNTDNQTSVNLKECAKLWDFTPNQTYNWSVKATKTVNGVTYDLTKYATGTYTYKAKDELQNVVLSGDVVSWDAFEGATYYTFYFGIYADEIRDGLSFNLKEYADEHNFADGEYDFEIKASNATEPSLSELSTRKYTYTNKSYNLWVNGEKFSEDKLTINCGEGTAVYDYENGTLTLTNATITDYYEYKPYYMATIYSEIGNLTIILEGENLINISESDVDGIDTKTNCNLTIQGGKLTIQNALYGFYIGDYEGNQGSLTFDGTEVYVDYPFAAGIWANYNIDMIDSDIKVIKDNVSYNGIVANKYGNISVTNSDLYVSTVMSAILLGNGENTTNTFSVDSGNVTIISENYGIEKVPWSSDPTTILGQINIYDGVVNVTSANGGTNLDEYSIYLAAGNEYTKGTSLTESGNVVINGVSVKGDMDGDGRITVADIRMLIQGYIHPEDLTEEQFAAGDMDEDGIITVADIRRLIQEYVKP